MSPELSAKIISGLIFIVGIVNFLPLAGILSSAKLESAYGIAVNDPNLEILLKHRALLFGLVGGVILYAAFAPALHPVAFILGFISMLGFVFITWQTGDANPLLWKIAFIDIAATALLLIALVLKIAQR